MMLLEHDAKSLLSEAGIPIPAGVLVANPEAAVAAFAPAARGVVKAQVPVGGRGKAGGIVATRSPEEIRAALRRLLGSTLKGHRVRSCRIEEAVEGSEGYVALTLDPESGRVRVLVSAAGGVDVERLAAGSLRAGIADYQAQAVASEIVRLAADLDGPRRKALNEAAVPLATLFFSLEALLLEINPLFVREDGSWVAGDAKLAVDDNALARQPRLNELVRSRAADYPEIHLKLSQGFDFLVLDELGEIGLVTTGAGLSMQLVDEITARGFVPFDFCDIRTGQFRGDPARLVSVLQWIAAGRNVRSVLMNFFAGITHLGELARVIVTALEQVPELQVPITLRMIGNGYEEALSVFGAADLAIHIEVDLEKALEISLQPLARRGS